ncbi:MAG: hypothetical protein GON13_02755 [Nanoarchaeota archaeon]|nr:hypothetical protein [Nanoarchaeota archaeon]
MSDSPIIEFKDDKPEKKVEEVKEIKEEIVKPEIVKPAETPFDRKPKIKKDKFIARDGEDLVFNFPSNMWFYTSILLVFLIGASVVTHGFNDVTGYFTGVDNTETPVSVVPVISPVNIIRLTDVSCADCSPLDIHNSVLGQVGVNIGVVEEYDLNSAEGRALIDKYSITEVPVVLISPVLVSNYSQIFTDVYAQIGSVESDGWYVFRGNSIITGFIYRDLITGEITGYPLPGNFLKTGDDVCVEDGKPVVYLFSGTTCVYCTWERPVFVNATSQFGEWIDYDGGNSFVEASFESDYVVVHAVEIDVETESPHLSVMSKYGGSGTPFFVLGCSYMRPGAGTAIGEEAEFEVLTAGICALTGGEPVEVCDAVSDVSAQFK